MADKVDTMTDAQIEKTLLADGIAEDHQHAIDLRGDYRTLRAVLLRAQ